MRNLTGVVSGLPFTSPLSTLAITYNFMFVCLSELNELAWNKGKEYVVLAKQKKKPAEAYDKVPQTLWAVLSVKQYTRDS